MYVEKHSICAFRMLHTGLRDVQFPPPLKQDKLATNADKKLKKVMNENVRWLKIPKIQMSIKL